MGSRYRMVTSDYLPNPESDAYVKLNGHKLQALSGLDVRSVTLTSDSLSISYSKEATEIAPEGYVGIDRNLNNVTTASIDKMVRRYDLSKVTDTKSTYRHVKSRFQRNDARIRTRVFSKYGEKQGTVYNRYFTACPRE